MVNFYSVLNMFDKWLVILYYILYKYLLYNIIFHFPLTEYVYLEFH